MLLASATRLGARSRRACLSATARYVSGFAAWDFNHLRNEPVKPYAPGSPDRVKLKKVRKLLGDESRPSPSLDNVGLFVLSSAVIRLPAD